MNKRQIIGEFWSTLGMFWHPSLRLLLARKICTDSPRPIEHFEPDIETRMVALMTDLMTLEDVMKLLQSHAVRLKQHMMIEDERLAMTNTDLFTSLSSRELAQGVEVLLSLFEQGLPELLPASQYEREQLMIR